MSLVRLVYFSRASKEMSLAELKSILEVARKNNSSLGICGMLSYDKSYFLQALEGEREEVNELYLDIADDPRHDEITIISYQEIEQPVFREWQMGYAGSSAEFNKLMKQLGQDDFSPDEMTADQAYQFLVHLSQNQQDI